MTLSFHLSLCTENVNRELPICIYFCNNAYSDPLCTCIQNYEGRQLPLSAYGEENCLMGLYSRAGAKKM